MVMAPLQTTAETVSLNQTILNPPNVRFPRGAMQHIAALKWSLRFCTGSKSPGPDPRCWILGEVNWAHVMLLPKVGFQALVPARKEGISAD